MNLLLASAFNFPWREVEDSNFKLIKLSANNKKSSWVIYRLEFVYDICK
ncbi:hypothetical protein LLB_2424 [Legionella longbeachae D-4968]|nr:hypothetical protein LLB_2424 [Legionella longbeachae D-4968]